MTAKPATKEVTMNPHKEAQIRELAEVEFLKRQIYDRWCMQPVKWEYEAGKQQAIDFAVVKAEWVIAKDELDRAMRRA